MTLDEILFPPLAPYATHAIPVGEGHVLHVEECGNPGGIPLLYLHGGPGGGFRPHNRRYWDPARFRIVLFDQRGAGRSTPHSETAANTTAHLIADIETIRLRLGVERWVIAGGSWGSFLALAYAEAHPARVREMLLRGIFLGRESEVAWWWTGTRQLFPDKWEALVAVLDEAEREAPLAAFHRRLMSPDAAVHGPAAVALRTWSAWTVQFRGRDDYVAGLADVAQALPISRLFVHYCVNRFFVAEGALLAGIGRIANIPVTIVQGRYDVVTPMRTAWELHRAWPGSRLVVVNDANHSIDEPEMAAALVAAQAGLACA
ncbi:MAG: prolyl aminopeptidase [Acetobacteraceae bacterium]|jgi:proline iminopeptidase|nr:prolyl aminopeptidase [Acetobacteraceae bacterium]